MSHLLRILPAAILVAALAFAGCTQPGPQQAVQVSPGLNMSVPFAPVPVMNSDGANLAYELELSRAAGPAIVPEKVEVIDPDTGNVLWTADGDVLAALWHPAADPPPTAEERWNGTGKVPVPRVSVWFIVNESDVPARLAHRLTLNRSAEKLPPLTVTGGNVTVRKDRKPVVIGSPMKGPGWLAMETTSPFTHHFRSQLTLRNVTRVPQRYAQDWIYVDPATGRTMEGNASLAKSYFGYGKEIHAVANGTVADMLDGLPDLELTYSPPPPAAETAAGNYVIEDLGNGKFACYAHMVNGSVRVKKGDTLTEGQVIGLMGNSGNSDIPHLHFQVVTDTPSFLGAEGYPHVYRSFEVMGRANETLAVAKLIAPGATPAKLFAEFPDIVTFLQKPEQRENMLPDNYDIVRLP